MIDALLSRNNGESMSFIDILILLTETLIESSDINFLKSDDKKSKFMFVIFIILNITFTCSGKYGVISGKYEISCNVLINDQINSNDPPRTVTSNAPTIMPMYVSSVMKLLALWADWTDVVKLLFILTLKSVWLSQPPTAVLNVL